MPSSEPSPPRSAATPPVDGLSPRSAGLTVRGAAVRRRGAAILLPGADGRGTTRLVAALVRAGAEVVADGEVPLDDAGRVRAPGGATIEMALGVSTSYHPGVVWQPAALAEPR